VKTHQVKRCSQKGHGTFSAFTGHFVDTPEASHGANKEIRQLIRLLDIIGDILQQLTNLSGLYFILYYI
jgi:hypothetical protein